MKTQQKFVNALGIRLEYSNIVFSSQNSILNLIPKALNPLIHFGLTVDIDQKSGQPSRPA